MTEMALHPVSEIGIPLVFDDGEEFFDHFPPNWNADLEAIIQKTPPGIYRADQDLFRLVQGPSLTVSMVSGDPLVAGKRFRHYGAYAENMEGSAVAQACRRFHIPAVECRGMSNLAGVRAKESWQMEKSIAHCHGIVINWLEALKSLTVPGPVTSPQQEERVMTTGEKI